MDEQGAVCAERGDETDGHMYGVGMEEELGGWDESCVVVFVERAYVCILQSDGRGLVTGLSGVRW